MRKHDVRKWLHAILDLLPVILIPVFMIYSHRHDVTERNDVEVTYKYQSNEVNSVDDLIEGNIYHFELVENNLDTYWSMPIGYAFDMLFINIESYDFSEFANSFEFDEKLTHSYIDDGIMALGITISTDLEAYFYTYITYNEDNDYLFSFTNSIYWDSGSITLIGDFIYLGGNVSLREGHSFNELITQTDYNVIESVEINDTNSDIMSVFMDDFNNSIDKYFNMGNVFNLNGVYEWFNTNIFNGNAPTIIYSIWNIALYELIMDLLFLLYGLFMWFIDMIQKLMEKPLNSVR